MISENGRSENHVGDSLLNQLHAEIATREGRTSEQVQAEYERRKALRELPYVRHEPGEREAVAWALEFATGVPAIRDIPEGEPATFVYDTKPADSHDDTPPPMQDADGWITPEYEAWDRQRRPELYENTPTVGELRQELRTATQSRAETLIARHKARRAARG